MLDIAKILQLVDKDKEVFLAREDKPVVVIMSIDKYEELKKDNSNNANTNNIAMNIFDTQKNQENDTYGTRVKSALMD